MKLMNEKETRNKLFSAAKAIGCERELIEILNKYDALVKHCSNERERKDIAALGAVEIHKLFGAGTGTLEIDGKIILKNDDVKEIK